MEDCEIRRKDIPKFLNLYKELKNSVEDPEKNEPETSEARQSLSDTSSDEEVDIITTGDQEKLEYQSNISDESFTSEKLRSTSSCSSLTVHVCTYEGCDKFFSRPYRLAQHIRTHTGERPYECVVPNCGRSYARQQHLKRHMETTHQDRNTEEKLKCVVCDKMISNLHNLRKHVQRFHERKRYECSECGQSFTKQQHLQTHSYVHTGIKPYACDYPGCEKRCSNPSLLKRHKLIHQKSRYVCPQESCQRKFDIYKDLQHHISADHPKVCDICSRPFKQLRFLRKHRLTHETSVEAYFCPYQACDKHYLHLSNLTTHIKAKHQQQKIYGCGVCDKRLSTKQKLIQHMNTHDRTYKRKYGSEKPRKVRKDKGCTRRDFACLLSGYTGDEEEDGMSLTTQPETTPVKNVEATRSVDTTQNPESEERSRDISEEMS